MRFFFFWTRTEHSGGQTLYYIKEDIITVHPSIHHLDLLILGRGAGGAGAYPSVRWVRGSNWSIKKMKGYCVFHWNISVSSLELVDIVDARTLPYEHFNSVSAVRHIHIGSNQQSCVLHLGNVNQYRAAKWWIVNKEVDIQMFSFPASILGNMIPAPYSWRMHIV